MEFLPEGGSSSGKVLSIDKGGGEGKGTVGNGDNCVKELVVNEGRDNVEFRGIPTKEDSAVIRVLEVGEGRPIFEEALRNGFFFSMSEVSF